MTARLTAGSIHELSHACVAIELRVGFRKVDIIRRGDVSGALLESRVIFPSDDQIERSIIVGFAGGLAQRRFAPRSNWARAMGHDGLAPDPCYDDGPTSYHVKVAYGTDLHNINERLKTLGRYGDAAYRAQLEARSAMLVCKLRLEIKIVAAELLKRRTLTQAEVRRLMIRGRRKAVS